jgi:predicted MFS family arabinose efflux permease
MLKEEKEVMGAQSAVAAATLSPVATRRPAALYWLALGTFAIGTEGFMIAALLTTIASDIRVSVAEVGLVVSIFALAYALSSPVLTALTGRVDRRQLLLGSMSLAGALVPAEQRGRAIAIVNGGLTAAIALGVPLGALVGERLGWRMTFVGVAALSTIAAYAVYTYIAPLLYGATAQRGSQIGAALFTWGAAAGFGLFISGNATDRFGTKVVLRGSLTSLAFALSGLAVVANVVAPSAAVLPVLAATGLWGMSGWAFFPAQQTRFIELVGVPSAPVALSLNASFMYLGFSLGAALGGFSLVHIGTRHLGFVGAACELAALTLLLVNQARDEKSPSDLVTSVAVGATSTTALE